jgi:hypothetical protein
MAVCIAIGLFGLSLLLVEPLALCLRTLICPRVSFSARQQQRTRVATYTPTLAGVIVVFSFRARGARGRCVRSRLRVAVRSRCGGGVTVVTGADVALALLGGRFVAAVRIMPCRAGRCMRVAVAVRRSRDGRRRVGAGCTARGRRRSRFRRVFEGQDFAFEAGSVSDPLDAVRDFGCSSLWRPGACRVGISPRWPWRFDLHGSDSRRHALRVLRGESDRQ